MDILKESEGGIERQWERGGGTVRVLMGVGWGRRGRLSVHQSSKCLCNIK